ncbi:transcriptional regulator, LysR family [Catenulispora acidiphila DSM 44928]|uniref:Transcriptional regulator, LysR family n=1 Tax=Catenulispora acidiphila (strain DSM 44928 / JCM 14897 / NBRC 102108 / NRRL B-24433 / ID139908) TaxID=479433 RepID=C7QDJ9_CATAD|nr:LysR family transcriptional regulator [Catenulispora acidiphila]ACU74623.1 transcriptional regulator, LysR family [Catenulispora acidiphila DSM 44928]
MIDDISLRHLRSFLVVAQESGITRAAVRLHVTQQTLSQQIQNLERALGVTLLVRTSRGVTLTAAGEHLACSGRTLMDDAESLYAGVRAAAAGRVGRLRVATASHPTTQLAIELANAIEADHPGFDVEIHTVLRPVEAMAELHAGTSDAALLWLPTGDPDLRTATFRSDPRAVLLAEGHRLAGSAQVTLADLADDPVVIVDAFGSPAVQAHRIADPRPDGRPAVRGPVVATLEDCLTQIRRGHGVWFAPIAMAEWAVCPGVALVPVTDLEPADLAVAWTAAAPRELVERLVAAARGIVRS